VREGGGEGVSSEYGTKGGFWKDQNSSFTMLTRNRTIANGGRPEWPAFLYGFTKNIVARMVGCKLPKPGCGGRGARERRGVGRKV
jgi:hypothetical protein